MHKKIRLAFLGCGYMGQNAHLKNYYELPNECELVALCDLRPERARLVAARYGIPRVFASYQEMLAGAEFDAVVAAQSFDNHINIVPEVLKSGKPLLTEKPLCVGYGNAVRLAQMAEDNHTLHMVAYHKRSDPASEYAKGVIEAWRASGACGKMRMMRISMPPGNWVGGAPNPLESGEPYPELVREVPPSYFPGKLGEDYVTFVNYYIHQVNYMNFILDEQVHVDFAEKTGALLVASGESGVPATLEMAAYEVRDDWHEAIFVAFERGYVRVLLPAPLADRQPGRVIVYDGAHRPATTAEIELPRLSAMQNQARNFLAALRGERRPPCDSRQAAEDLRVATEYIKVLNGLELGDHRHIG